MLLVLPEAAALLLTFLVNVRAAEAISPTTRLVVLVSVVIGATRAGTHPVIATSMSDMVSCTLILGRVLILLRLDERLASARWPGCCSGVDRGRDRPDRLRRLVAVSAVHLLRQPDVSARQRHPPVAAGAVRPLHRHPVPRNRLQTVPYPFPWAIDATPLVTEPDQPMRHPRVALALLACVGLLGLSVRRRARVPGSVRFLAVLALTVFRGRSARRAVLIAMPVLLYTLVLYTVPPHWGRLPQAGDRPITVRMPGLAPEPLVLLLHASPLAFLAVFQPAAVRFYGPVNNLTQPWTRTLMAARIRDGIDAQLRDHPDLLWGLDRPDHRYGNADDALAACGLHRAGCRTMKASIVYGPIRLCRLARS